MDMEKADDSISRDMEKEDDSIFVASELHHSTIVGDKSVGSDIPSCLVPKFGSLNLYSYCMIAFERRSWPLNSKT